MNNNIVDRLPIIIILIGLIIGFLLGFFFPGTESDNDQWKLKYQSLQQEYYLLEKVNNQYHVKIETFKNEKSKIDSITDGYDNGQLDSFYTDFFER